MSSLYQKMQRVKYTLFMHKEAFVPYFIYSLDDKVSDSCIMKLKKLPRNQIDFNDEVFDFLSRFDDKDSVFRCLDFHMDRYSAYLEFIKYIEKETHKRLEKQKKRSKWHYFKFLDMFIMPHTVVYEYCLEWVMEKRKNKGYSRIKHPIKRNNVSFSEYKILQFLYWFLNLSDDNGRKVFDTNNETIAHLAMNFEPFNERAFLTVCSDNIPTILPGDKQQKNGVEMVNYNNEFEKMMEPYRKYLLDPSNVKTRVNQKKKR